MVFASSFDIRDSLSCFGLIGLTVLTTTCSTRALNPAAFIANAEVSCAQVVVAAVTVRHSEFGASIGVPLSKITTLGCIQGCVWREIIPYDLLLERRRFIPPNNEQANRIREFCALNKRIKNKMAELWIMSDPIFFFAESYLDHGCAHLPNVKCGA